MTADLPMPVPTVPKQPLSTYSILSFDVYGTLIQYKSAILNSFTPLIARLPLSSPYRDSERLSTHIPDSATKGDVAFLKLFQKTEDTVKLELETHPRRFDEILQVIWGRVARELDVDVSEEEAGRFGSRDTIESWKCFDGTINALKVLSRKYKLVALSNVDRYATEISWEAAQLSGVEWVKVFTAEDFGSDLENADRAKFETLLEFVKGQGVEKEKVLHVAQSLGHDHAPCKTMGVASVFLIGDGPVFGKEEESRMAIDKDLVGYGWRCKDLSEFAAFVEKDERE